MAAAKTIEKQIAEYVGHLNVEQKKVLLSVVKSFAGNYENEYNQEFVAEMDKRFEEMERGIKTITLDELEMNARSAYRAKKARR